MKKHIVLFLLVLVSINAVRSQTDSRAITTAVPFLLVTSNARAAGMGDIGVATSADAYSQYWNPAKYAFAKQKIGIGVSYTPYLAELVNDISLMNLSFYNKFNERSSFAFSLRYFGLGEIDLRSTADGQVTTVKPNELALDGSYALKLSETFSMGIGARYIRSNLKIPTGADASAASSFGVDIAAFYQSRERAFSSFDGILRAGLNISNIGPKINYDGDISNDLTGDFLPTNMKLGVGFDFIFDSESKLAVTTEFNKLLVPIPKGNTTQDIEEYQRIGFVSGIFKSFEFTDSFKEITWALGAEYVFQDAFSLRGGYFNEAEEKGARKFFTLGAGFKFNVGEVDLSYLFSSSAVKNPLENTLRFSLTFNLGDRYED